MSTQHFILRTSLTPGRYRTACGRTVRPDRATTGVDEVTCRQCRFSLAYWRALNPDGAR